MKKAEVRSFESLTQYFAERFERRLDVAQDEYAAVLLDLSQFLQAERIELKMLDPVNRSAPPSRAPIVAANTSGPSVTLFWVIGMVTGFCLGYVCFGA